MSKQSLNLQELLQEVWLQMTTADDARKAIVEAVEGLASTLERKALPTDTDEVKLFVELDKLLQAIKEWQ